MDKAGALLLAAAPAPPAFTTDAAAAVDGGALVRAHFEYVWRALRRLGLSRPDADDAAQRVFLVALARPVRRETARAYLYGIAVRVAQETRRSLRRVHPPAAAEPDELPAAGEPQDDLVDLRRARVLLDELLGTLKFEQRAVFVLHEIEGLPVPEVALALGVPEGTVASRLRRARAAFHAALERSRARERFERDRRAR